MKSRKWVILLLILLASVVSGCAPTCYGRIDRTPAGADDLGTRDSAVQRRGHATTSPDAGTEVCDADL